MTSKTTNYLPLSFGLGVPNAGRGSFTNILEPAMATKQHLQRLIYYTQCDTLSILHNFLQNSLLIPPQSKHFLINSFSDYFFHNPLGKGLLFNPHRELYL